MSITMEKFLEKYPDPEVAFTNQRVSRHYRRHVTAYLLNRFPAMAEDFIKEAVFLVGPRLRAIVRYLAEIDNQDTVCAVRLIREQKQMPKKRDVEFYDELYFTVNAEDT
jgi:hypothetical protein